MLCLSYKVIHQKNNLPKKENCKNYFNYPYQTRFFPKSKKFKLFTFIIKEFCLNKFQNILILHKSIAKCKPSKSNRKIKFSQIILIKHNFFKKLKIISFIFHN